MEENFWKYQAVEKPNRDCYRRVVQHRIRLRIVSQKHTVNPDSVLYYLWPVLEEHIADMLDKGLTEPSTSPWSAPVVLVPKKITDDTIKCIFCTHFGTLNSVTKSHAYPLLLIQGTLENLGQCRYFTTLNLVSG